MAASLPDTIPDTPRSRRDLLELLTVALGSATAASLTGCSTSQSGKSGSSGAVDDDGDDSDGGSGGGGGDDGGTLGPPPTFDTAALSEALDLALGAIPVEANISELMAGVQTELDALHEAGLVESASWLAEVVDSVVTELSGSFGAAFPANGPLDDADRQALSAALVSSLSSASASLHARMPALADELTDVWGGDSVPSDGMTGTLLGEHETEIRKWLHAQDVGEGGMSGQAAANGLLHMLQGARADAARSRSIASTTGKLTDALDILGSVSSAARQSRNRAWRRTATSPPPPDVVTDFCSDFESVAFVIDLALDFRTLLRSGLSAADTAIENFYEWLADLPEQSYRAREMYWSWVAEELSGDVINVSTGRLESTIRGETVTDLTEADCSFFNAVLLTALFLIDMVLTFIATLQLITPVFQALALSPTGGLLAALYLLVLVIALYYFLKVFCSAYKVMPALTTLMNGCPE